MLANETTAGNLAALSRRLKTPKTTLWLWYRGEVLPSLEASLNICYHFNLSLADFFTGEMKENPRFDNWKVPNQQFSVTVSSRSFNSEVARVFLERVLAQETSSPLSVTEIARQLGCNRRMLYKHFPDLCFSVSTIYRQYLKRSYEENLAYYCQQVRQIVAQLYAEGKYPSENQVAKLMDKPGFLRYTEVRLALKLARIDSESATTD